MNTINGNFIEKSIPNIKNATIALNIGGVDSTMAVEKFAAEIASVAPYKVFTALLTQSGGDDPAGLNSGSLTIGVTYKINDIINGDFTNVGAPNNTVGTYFIATGTTPNAWGDIPLDSTIISYNAGAPVAIVLENTIGNVWFEYNSVGTYTLNSIGLFTINKSISIFMPNQYVESPTDLHNLQIFQGDINIFYVGSLINYNGSDGLLGSYAQTSIEIRVYN